MHGSKWKIKSFVSGSLSRLTGNTNSFTISLLEGEAGFKGLAPFGVRVRLLNMV